MDHQALELNLINALSKLQHKDFDKEYLAEENRLTPETVAEQHFAFSIGQHHFVVRASSFCEVFVDLPMASVPNAPEILLGLCNIRGVLVPVYQLHSALNCARRRKRYIFCVGKGEQTIGLLIDGLPSSLGLSQQDCVHDNTLEDNSVLHPLITQTYFSGQIMRHLLDGDLLGERLLALASNRKQEIFSAVLDQHSSSSFSA